jgi:DNA adenine methylase Dam
MTNKEGYLEMRKFYNEHRHPLDLYVCICYAFNYSIRFNSKGEFNIAFGKDRSCFNSALEERLKVFIEKIRDIKFINKDFRTISVDKLNKDDLVYCDPPYLITDANYNENGGWTEQHENDLLKLLDKIHNQGSRFALSNVLESKGKSNDLLKEWSNKYNIHILDYHYGNCNYQTKDKSTNSTIEVLITNY